jgi:V/A-type H+-transporting ATPase subunit B
MKLEHIGLKEIEGSMIILEGIRDASYEELIEVKIGKEKRLGRIMEISGDVCVAQLFEGTKGLSLTNTTTKLLGHPLEMHLSKEILGRIFDGIGRPIDGLGEIYANEKRDINGKPINPLSRQYPRNFIQTGISSIDALATLIRGQKLPIFSGNGISHNALAAQIVNQAKIADQKSSEFAIIFAAMGVKYDVSEYFKKSFEKSGVLERVVMFTNLASDPIVERTVTPRCALTAAEYLAFIHDMHVLVIMTDMTSYAEAIREISSSRGEIPSRKGFPGYLYSDLASLYERAGMVEGKNGSITQIPILTMPNDDITHPIPDLTGYITEGQIVLSRDLQQKGIYPPISILPSLSRIMKDGIGEGFTRKDHPELANQLFASYARVQEVRALASVIGEEELSQIDNKYMNFGRKMEEAFISQEINENRNMIDTLNLGWELLSLLPKEELSRVSPDTLKSNYNSRLEEGDLF